MSKYSLKEATRVFSIFATVLPERGLELGNLSMNREDFYDNQKVINAMSVIYAISNVLPLHDSYYRHIVQFFILTIQKLQTYHSPDHNGEFTAYHHAVNYFLAELGMTPYSVMNPNYKDVEKKVQRTLENWSANKEELIDFFSCIEVVSDWAVKKPFIVHKENPAFVGRVSTEKQSAATKLVNNISTFLEPNKLVKTLGRNLSESLSENLSKNMTLNNLTSLSFAKVINQLQSDPLKQLLGDSCAHTYYQSIESMPVDKRAKHAKQIEVFCMVLNHWCKLPEQACMLEKKLQTLVDYEVNTRTESVNPQLQHDIEQLFKDYLRQTIQYLELVRDKHPTQTLAQIQTIEAFCDKLLQIYMDSFNHKMKVLNRFLQTKINDLG